MNGRKPKEITVVTQALNLAINGCRYGWVLIRLPEETPHGRYLIGRVCVYDDPPFYWIEASEESDLVNQVHDALSGDLDWQGDRKQLLELAACGGNPAMPVFPVSDDNSEANTALNDALVTFYRKVKRALKVRKPNKGAKNVRKRTSRKAAGSRRR